MPLFQHVASLLAQSAIESHSLGFFFWGPRCRCLKPPVYHPSLRPQSCSPYRPSLQPAIAQPFTLNALTVQPPNLQVSTRAVPVANSQVVPVNPPTSCLQLSEVLYTNPQTPNPLPPYLPSPQPPTGRPSPTWQMWRGQSHEIIARSVRARRSREMAGTVIYGSGSGVVLFLGAADAPSG